MISIKETTDLKKELISKAQEKHKKAKSFKQFRKDAARTPLKKGEVRKLVNGKWVSNKKEEVEHIDEKKKGLWDNIHAKRKRGEPPAKKGDKDYPKTLNVEAKVEHIGEMPSASNLKFGIPKGLPGLGGGGGGTNAITDKAQTKNYFAGLPGLGGGGGGTDAITAKAKTKSAGKLFKDLGNLANRPFRTKADRLAADPRSRFATEAKTAAWQRKEGKNKKGGLNEKGRKSYERENPGSDLKAPQPEGGPRKRSFCARMGGVKGPMKKPDGSPTRKALALRKWKC